MFEKFFFLSITAAICTFILGIFGGVTLAHMLHPHLQESPLTLNETTQLQKNLTAEHNQRIICEKTLRKLQH